MVEKCRYTSVETIIEEVGPRGKYRSLQSFLQDYPEDVLLQTVGLEKQAEGDPSDTHGFLDLEGDVCAPKPYQRLAEMSFYSLTQNSRQRTVIGRGEDSALRLQYPDVSATHASLSKQTGQWVLTVLSGTLPVYVRSTRFDQGMQVPLLKRDEIIVGRVSLICLTARDLYEMVQEEFELGK